MNPVELHPADRAVPGTSTSPVRTAPAWGAFSATVLGIEIRRMLRNRRTVVFTLVLPMVFFLLFGRGQDDPQVQAYVLVSFAVYGALVATTAGGAMVAIERAHGWSRQLRLTPLHPLAYMATKVVVAMLVALVSVVVALAAGAVTGVRMPLHVWVLSGLAAWAGSIVFAAFGLAMGYLLPSENVMQILGPALGILAFLGGLFAPVDSFGSTMAAVARATPVYGVGALARSPLLGQGAGLGTVVNVLAWTAVFVAGAALLLRRDTART